MTNKCEVKVTPNTAGREAPCILQSGHQGDHRISISQWLVDLGSHEIYIADAIETDFTRHTGELPCWKTHTAQATRQAIHVRGVGGSFEGNSEAAYGYEIAEALAFKYATFRSIKLGRGSLFRDCLDALEKAGL